HAGRLECPAGQGGTHVAHAVHVVGQRLDIMAADIQFVLDVQHAGSGHHQVRLDVVDPAQRLQQAHRVQGAGGARDADDQPPHRRHAVVAPAVSSSVLSSPLVCISVMMSEPPMNSPLTYSCGIVGQLEYSLMPWRTSSSSSTLTVTSFLTPQS